MQFLHNSEVKHKVLIDQDLLKPFVQTFTPAISDLETTNAKKFEKYYSLYQTFQISKHSCGHLGRDTSYPAGRPKQSPFLEPDVNCRRERNVY